MVDRISYSGFDWSTTIGLSQVGGNFLRGYSISYGVTGSYNLFLNDVDTSIGNIDIAVNLGTFAANVSISQTQYKSWNIEALGVGVGTTIGKNHYFIGVEDNYKKNTTFFGVEITRGNTGFVSTRLGIIFDNPTTSPLGFYSLPPNQFSFQPIIVGVKNGEIQYGGLYTYGIRPDGNQLGLDSPIEALSMAARRDFERRASEVTHGTLEAGHANDRDSVPGYSGPSTGYDTSRTLSADRSGDRDSVPGYSGPATGFDSPGSMATARSHDRDYAPGYKGRNDGGTGGFTGHGPISGPDGTGGSSGNPLSHSRRRTVRTSNIRRNAGDAHHAIRPTAQGATHAQIHVTTGTNSESTDKLLKAAGAIFVGGRYEV